MTLPDAQRLTWTVGPCRIEYSGNKQTQVLGVVGHPIAHSLSPRMQQAALDVAGRNAVYLPLDVPAAELAPFVQDVRRSPAAWRGFNVTIPHKAPIVDLLDGVDEVARLAGAVNTVIIDAQRQMHGSNTDVLGLQEVWRQRRVVVRGRRLIILGAGGLARAAVVAGLQQGASEICVSSRSIERAQAMLDEVSGRWQGRQPGFRCARWGEDLASWLADASSVVQATPVGLGSEEAVPLSLEGAAPQLFVLESLYGAPTVLLQQAMQRRLPCTDGCSLLVAQGAASWRLWMHAEPDLEVMRQALAPRSA